MTGVTWRWSTVTLIALCVILATAGQLFMKVGMAALDVAQWGENVFELPSRADVLWPLGWALAGAGCYGLALLAYLGVLARLPLSVAYPLLSLSYVLVVLGAAWWSRIAEPLSVARLAGCVVIIFGVVLVARSPGGHEVARDPPHPSPLPQGGEGES